MILKTKFTLITFNLDPLENLEQNPAENPAEKKHRIQGEVVVNLDNLKKLENLKEPIKPPVKEPIKTPVKEPIKEPIKESNYLVLYFFLVLRCPGVDLRDFLVFFLVFLDFLGFIPDVFS